MLCCLLDTDAVLATQKRFFGGSVVGAAWSGLSGRVAALLTGGKGDDEEGSGGATPVDGVGFSPVDQVLSDQFLGMCLFISLVPWFPGRVCVQSRCD